VPKIIRRQPIACLRSRVLCLRSTERVTPVPKITGRVQDGVPKITRRVPKIIRHVPSDDDFDIEGVPKIIPAARPGA
jgi:hypothetical protein